jgi:hypothetical protein
VARGVAPPTASLHGLVGPVGRSLSRFRSKAAGVSAPRLGSHPSRKHRMTGGSAVWRARRSRSGSPGAAR